MAFDRFGMLLFFANLNFMKFQVRYLALFLLISVIDASGGSKWEVFSKIYIVNTGVPQGSILSPTLFLQNINDLSDDLEPYDNLRKYSINDIPNKLKQRYLQINLIFRLTIKPSSENVVKYIYSNK